MANKLGFNIKLAKPQKSIWKKRIQRKINALRKHLSRLDRWSKDELHNEATKDQLGNKVEDKGLKVVIEELKQWVAAISSKLRRYEARTKQYVQDRMFLTK